MRLAVCVQVWEISVGGLRAGCWGIEAGSQGCITSQPGPEARNLLGPHVS